MTPSELLHSVNGCYILSRYKAYQSRVNYDYGFITKSEYEESVEMYDFYQKFFFTHNIKIPGYKV